MDRKTQKPCERANSDCMRPLDLQMKLGLNDPLETRTQFNYFSQANANNSFRTRKKNASFNHNNNNMTTMLQSQCVCLRARAPARHAPYHTLTRQMNNLSMNEWMVRLTAKQSNCVSSSGCRYTHNTQHTTCLMLDRSQRWSIRRLVRATKKKKNHHNCNHK